MCWPHRRSCPNKGISAAKAPSTPCFYAGRWVLYGLGLGLGYWVITYRLTGYRYTLTDRALFVTRLTGRSEKLVVEIPIEAIEYAGPCDPGRLPKKPLRALADRKEPPTIVIYREGETPCALLINARGELKNRLTEPWKEGED